MRKYVCASYEKRALTSCDEKRAIDSSLIFSFLVAFAQLLQQVKVDWCQWHLIESSDTEIVVGGNENETSSL